MPTNNGMTNATESEDGTVLGPVFGHIPGYPVGSCFENRAELAQAGVHRHRQAGISGSASKGADSIVGAFRKGSGSASWVCASSSPIGATGNGVYCVRFSCTCSWRLPSPLASSSGQTMWITSSETTTTRLDNDPAVG